MSSGVLAENLMSARSCGTKTSVLNLAVISSTCFTTAFFMARISPERCYATGKGLEVATVGEQATAILHAVDVDGEECEQPLANTSCELVSDTGGPTVKAAIQKKEKNKYTISYQLTHRGRYQLHIKVEGVPIRGSPFAVIAVKNLTTPIKTISGLNKPQGAAFNQRREIIVAEHGGNCISIFSPSGEKIRTFGSEGSAQGQIQ